MKNAPTRLLPLLTLGLLGAAACGPTQVQPVIDIAQLSASIAHTQHGAFAPQSFGAQPSPWPDLSSPPAAPSDTPNTRDAAVLIAIDDYAFAPDVDGATRNIDDWYGYLRKTKNIPIERIALLRDAQGTREQILARAREIAAITREGGTLWFVFVGHGAPDKSGQGGRLVGVDAQQQAQSLYDRSVGQGELMALLNRGAQSNTVVILDACFNGRTASGAPLVPGLQPLIPVSLSALSERTLIFSAAGSDQFAGPLPRASRPALSYLILGGLRGWADHNDDATVTADELHAYADHVLGALVTDRQQRPELIGASKQLAMATAASEDGPDLDAIRLGPTATTPTPGLTALTTPAAAPPKDSAAPTPDEPLNLSRIAQAIGEDGWVTSNSGVQTLPPHGAKLAYATAMKDGLMAMIYLCDAEDNPQVKLQLQLLTSQGGVSAQFGTQHLAVVVMNNTQASAGLMDAIKARIP